MKTTHQHSEEGFVHTLSQPSYLSLPPHERVLDRLAELLFAADETLETLSASDTSKLAWVKPHVQAVYNTVNEVMKKLSD